ncbi:unnamed protein product [Meloidogyne enterolobii]|uniref:Uncharacterized protein n=1 Tax=Meloidogyne enterolobii TaxID=390850 RepID=A0ACB1ATW8_MELEN
MLLFLFNFLRVLNFLFFTSVIANVVVTSFSLSLPLSGKFSKLFWLFCCSSAFSGNFP